MYSLLNFDNFTIKKVCNIRTLSKPEKLLKCQWANHPGYI
ncbi:hypothetical protein DCCM_3524 [Desulfocucumis palustris]|uniref:Uncharacterized protein n=1 Tax=Desulfocucumis palustris TaxID=1898651 RepID=A0A2L2XKH1_9FIRM|nr:hypothetical protein DCCM_3524 [Desulfocucumis palustris]